MQKFHKGDLVQVAKDLGPSMSHFTSDCRAIVMGSYKDQFGGGDREYVSYTLYLEGRGRVSWYYESQLELIEKNRLDLLEEWEGAAKRKEELEGDLDWIFQNGESVLKSASGATVQALADAIGFKQSLWGPRGEGVVYYQNAWVILHAAKPFLLLKDKSGFLRFCDKVKLSHLDEDKLIEASERERRERERGRQNYEADVRHLR